MNIWMAFICMTITFLCGVFVGVIASESEVK